MSVYSYVRSLLAAALIGTGLSAVAVNTAQATVVQSALPAPAAAPRPSHRIAVQHHPGKAPAPSLTAHRGIEHGAASPAKHVTITVHYGKQQAKAKARVVRPQAMTPQAPFTECPPVNVDSSCQILVNITDSQYQILDDGTQGPFDGLDDSLIGVLNSSSQTVDSLTLSSDAAPFAFDGDGICYSGYAVAPSGCPFGTTGYEGPATSFSNIAPTQTGGTVDFTGGLAPGATAYFSLEVALDATTVFAGGPTLAEQGGAENPSEHRTTCFTQLPVNCATGTFVHTLDELRLPGRGVPLAFSLSYDSAAAGADGPVGHGWFDPYAMSLSLDSAGDATLVQENGSAVTFAPRGAGGFVAPPWVLATLVHNSDGTYTFTRKPSQESYVFSAAGQLSSEYDRNGYVTALTYANGQLNTVTDPDGRTLTFGYSGSHVTSVTDPLGRTVSLAYDAAGDLTKATDRAGRSTALTYDTNHQALTMTDPRGGVVTNVYDGAGRVIKQADQAGLTTTWSYTGAAASQSGGTTTMTDGHGNVTVYNYQNLELQSVTHGAGTSAAATTTYTYDPSTLGVSSTTDPDGHTTTATYDVDGNTLSTTDPLGNTTLNSYDSLDDLTSSTSPAGETTSFVYDGSGNLTSRTNPLGGTTTYAYADTSHPGDLTSITDPDGRVRTLTRDAYGDLASSTVAPGSGVSQTTTYVYDADGEQVCSASADATAAGISCPAAGQPPVSKTTTTVYDADGEATSTTNADGSTTSYGYDGSRNRISVIDADGHKTVTSYDPDSRVSSVTTGVGGSSPSTTTTTYDLRPGTGACRSGIVGAVYCTAESDASGHLTVDYLNSRDQMVQQATPVQPTSFGYDPAGNRVTATDSAGRTTTSTFDADNRLIGLTYSDGVTPSVIYTYDADGRRSTMSDGTGLTTFTWDGSSHLTGVTDGAGNSVAYGYDPAGDQTTVTYPGSQVVKHSYDGAGRMTSVSDWANRVTSFAYDGDGNLTSTTYPNGDTATSKYSSADHLDSTTVAPTASPASPLAAFAYSRDPAELIAKETDTGAISGTTSYAYDANGRLGSSNSAGYSYAGNGDPTTLAGTTSQTFNSADEVTSTTAGALTTSYGYDAVGERTTSKDPSGTATGYSYDQAGNLASVAKGSSFVPVTPARIADTRPGSGQPYAGQTLAPGGTLNIQVAGRGGVPAAGATAVVINLTIAVGSANTFLAVYPTGAPRPNSSVLNTPPNSVTNNQTTARLGSGGQLTLYNAQGSSNVVVDVLGYYTAAGSSFTSITPTRVADTRPGSGQPGAGNTLAPGGTLNVQITGANQDGVPANATAVTVETTVVAPTRFGYLTVYPSGISRTDTSNLNYVGGLNMTRETTVKLGTSPSGSINIDNTSAGQVDVVVDVVGYYAPSGQAFNPLSPVRIVDTRPGSGQPYAAQTLAPGASLTVKAAGLSGVPDNATGLELNVTVAVGSSYGFVNLYPAGVTRTNTTNVSYQANDVSFDQVTVALGTGGSFTIANTSSGKTDVIVDLAGYFAPGGGSAYTYDGDGLRIAKQVGTATEQFVWDRSRRQAEPLADGGLLFVDGPNGSPVEQVDAAGNASYFVDDAQGSTRLLLDGSGNVAATYSYDAFGRPTATTGTASTPIRYIGAYYDTESSLYYLINRYYDPASAQFLSVDALAAVTGTAYQYSFDDPINGSDPDGLMCWSAHCLLNDVQNVATGVTLVATGISVVAAIAVAAGTAPAWLIGLGALAAVTIPYADAVGTFAGTELTAMDCGDDPLGRACAEDLFTLVAGNVIDKTLGKFIDIPELFQPAWSVAQDWLVGNGFDAAVNWGRQHLAVNC